LLPPLGVGKNWHSYYTGSTTPALSRYFEYMVVYRGKKFAVQVRLRSAGIFIETCEKISERSISAPAPIEVFAYACGNY